MTQPITCKLIETLTRQSSIDGIQKIAVGAMIVRVDSADIRSLLLRRSKADFLGGLVEFPSGGVDIGEDLLAALAREVKEETNLNQLKILGYLGSFDYISGSGRIARQYNFLIRTHQTEVKLHPKEHDLFYWLSKLEFAKAELAVSPETGKILELGWNALDDLDLDSCAQDKSVS